LLVSLVLLVFNCDLIARYYRRVATWPPSTGANPC